MKASDLKVGDTVDGWTVTRARNARELVEGFFCDSVVLVTLERETEIDAKSDLGWSEVMPGTYIEAIRTWHPADEVVKP